MASTELGYLRRNLDEAYHLTNEANDVVVCAEGE
jgi:hypothetical protein